MFSFLVKLKNIISSTFTFYKLVTIWLLFITTILLFIEIEKLQEYRLSLVALGNLIFLLTSFFKEFKLENKDDGSNSGDDDLHDLERDLIHGGE